MRPVKLDLRAALGIEAQEINSACVRGDLAAAYSVLKKLNLKDANNAMLVAGFSNIGIHHASCMQFLQSQLARACAKRLDGFDYRNQEQGA